VRFPRRAAVRLPRPAVPGAGSNAAAFDNGKIRCASSRAAVRGVSKGPELKEQLRKRGLSRTGKKAELAARLLARWERACCF
jgi:hypothetical protein